MLAAARGEAGPTVTEDHPPIELTPPDISAYRTGNTGVDFVTTFDSGRPGPHVMVNAVTHGNELCGAIAVDFLFRHEVRPQCGKLTLSFANYMAYLEFDPDNPTASRFVDEDFNRLWDEVVLDGPRNSVELTRAREMRPIVDTVDYLLDIHSMQTSVAPLMLAGPLEKGRRFAQRIAYPEHVVCDEGHAAGRRLRDYGAFADPESPRNALLVECGQHWEKASAEVALETTLRFLDRLGVIDSDFAARHLRATPGPQKIIEVTEAVTIGPDGFRFEGTFDGLEVIPRAGTILGYNGDAPVTTPYDDCVLIMPSKRLQPGQTAVRLGRFVA